MNIKTRLAKLEAKLNAALKTVWAFSIDGVFNEEQQAKIAKAEAEGLPVQVIQYAIIE
jgi:hypothetical protein